MSRRMYTFRQIDVLAAKSAVEMGNEAGHVGSQAKTSADWLGAVQIEKVKDEKVTHDEKAPVEEWAAERCNNDPISLLQSL